MKVGCTTYDDIGFIDLFHMKYALLKMRAK